MSEPGPGSGDDLSIIGLLEEGETAAVVTPGRSQRFGAADRAVGLASVTKPVVALGVLVAVEEGTLTLDEPAGPPGATVRHLLSHTAGYADTRRIMGEPGISGTAGEPESGRTIVATPGTRRIYSNSGFEVLAEHLASASGLPWSTYVSEAVLDPLGMSGARFVGPAGSGLVATASDVIALAEELLAPSLISDTTSMAMRSVQFADTAGVVPGYGQYRPCPWGLGVEIKGAKSPHWTPPSASPATFGHFGANGSFLWIDPDAGCGGVFVSDRAFGPWAVQRWPGMGEALLDLGAHLTG